MVSPARNLFGAVVASALLASAQPRAPVERPPTFARDVAPIVFGHCASCHYPGGPGPFSLLTFTAARQHAGQMAAVTTSRYMPPWKPEPGSGEFVGAHRLTSAEIDVIQRWAATGALEGNRADLPPLPKPNNGWQLGVPDLVVNLPAYDLPASGTDVFRIFVVPVPLQATKFVRGFEFHPGGSNILHHANIRVDRTPASRLLDAEDPAPGYMGLLSHSATYPDGHFLAWTPGQTAPLLPKGLAWRLDPTTDFVVELHLQPTGKPEQIHPSIGLYFGTDPPTRVPAMVRLGRQSIDISPGDARYIINDSFVLPVDVQVLAVQPHAHYLARDVRGTVTLPNGTVRPLITISDWDFRWQQVYRYVTPLALPAGTMLGMQYLYDNSDGNVRNPQRPPNRVIWGQRSADEMGDLWIQVLPRTDGDLERLVAALRPKVLAEDIIGYEARLQAEPDSVALHDDVALLHLELGHAARAVDHFRRSQSLRPDSAATNFNLGTALAFAGQDAEAIMSYTTALHLRPDYALAHNNLGGLLLRRGDLVGAASHLEEAVRLAPDNADAQHNLGLLLWARRDDAAARDRFLAAAALRPDWAAPLVAAAEVLTAGVPSVRDAARALPLAQRAVQLTRGRDAEALSAVGAAYAETGDVERAIAATEQALAIASGAHAAEIAARLESYHGRLRARP